MKGSLGKEEISDYVCGKSSFPLGTRPTPSNPSTAMNTRAREEKTRCEAAEVCSSHELGVDETKRRRARAGVCMRM